MDLSPRDGAGTGVVDAAPRVRPPARRPWLPIVVLGAVLVAGGVLVFKFLNDAVDYYCNVDEIGRKDGCEVGRTIRIQGVVDEGSLADDTGQAGGDFQFVITWNDVSMPIRVGSAPTGDLFQECIPVVVSGKVVDDPVNGRYFEGGEVIVKHDNQYDAANPDRVAQGEEQAAACSRKG